MPIFALTERDTNIESWKDKNVVFANEGLLEWVKRLSSGSIAVIQVRKFIQTFNIKHERNNTAEV